MMQNNGAHFWDKFDFSYQAQGSDTELHLPLKLLLLGDFSGSNDFELSTSPIPVSIDASSFDRVLASHAISLSLEVAQPADNSGLSFELMEIPLNGLSDFEPAQLVQNVPYLNLHLSLIRELQAADDAVECSALSDAARQLLQRCGVDVETISLVERDFICMDINEHLHQMLDGVLQDDQFQHLEALWRSVWQVCQVADAYDDCHVDLLDVSKAALNDDFVANRDVRESLLFDVVYFSEFAQYGGQPYGAIVADYEFGHGTEDVQLLRSIAQVGYAAHVPFISGASPQFFGREDFSDMGTGLDLQEQLSGPRYIKWRNLLQESWANYLALALPRILVRQRYDYPAGHIGLLPYREGSSLSSGKSLLGNAAFGFAQCLLNSFGELGICTRIAGETGGQTDTPFSEAPSYGRYPVETRFSERKISELVLQGFLPLTVNAASGQLYFPVAYSLRWGGLHQPGWQINDSFFDSQVEAQLPYLFVVARIAHYLKVVQRESLGSLQSTSELETELNRWLRRYISDVDNPAPGIRMRKPLRQAELRVLEDSERGGLHMQLSVTPHMKFQGQDFTLALNLLAE
ncbi:MAG: type VI secretion system contractile sheath large subunit [Oceanospirillaceae bacterium]|nr:type VI secretion system contractile sheath large subunit [Oceanospirillaceae bacterium]